MIVTLHCLPASSPTSSTVLSILTEWAPFWSCFMFLSERHWNTLWALRKLKYDALGAMCEIVPHQYYHVNHHLREDVLTWRSAASGLSSVYHTPDSQNHDGAQCGQHHNGTQSWAESRHGAGVGGPRGGFQLHHSSRHWSQHTNWLSH